MGALCYVQCVLAVQDQKGLIVPIRVVLGAGGLGSLLIFGSLCLNNGIFGGNRFAIPDRSGVSRRDSHPSRFFQEDGPIFL